MAVQAQHVHVICVNVDCAAYQLARSVTYPTVAAGVFVVGALHCAECGEPMIEPR